MSSFLAHTSVRRLDGVRKSILDFSGACLVRIELRHRAACSIASCAEAILFTLELQPQNGRLRVFSPRKRIPQYTRRLVTSYAKQVMRWGFFEFGQRSLVLHAHIVDFTSRQYQVWVFFGRDAYSAKNCRRIIFSRQISIPLPDCLLRASRQKRARLSSHLSHFTVAVTGFMIIPLGSLVVASECQIFP